jgi:hypothetical protein
MSELLEKITEIKKNLCIFKNAVNKTRNDLEKAFDRTINGLENGYHYRKFVEKRISNYKNLQKDIGTYIGTDEWEKYKNDINEEKKELEKVLKAYIKVRDVDSLEIANKTILLESDARDFMLSCMSDLIGALIELNGDTSDNIINDAESILNETKLI